MARPRASTLKPVALALALLLVVGFLWAWVVVDFGGAKGADIPPASLPSTSSESPQPEWTMSDAQRAFAQTDSRVLVLGDSTGDDYDEWVHLWAEGEELPVASWLAEAESGYESESPETRVWSASAPDATAAYPVEHWGEIWPSADPDLVVLSFGHAQESPGEATKELEALRVAIADRVEEAPVVVLLQNPEADDAGADMRQAIAAWAKESGLPTIDIATAFEDSGVPEADLRLDTFHPSGAGSQLWADTVALALA